MAAWMQGTGWSAIWTMGLFWLAAVPLQAAAEAVALFPSKDNTLYENPTGSLSNGAGAHFLAGRTGEFGGHLRRRGVLFFDIAGSGMIPLGSTINGVELKLNVNNEPYLAAIPQAFTLHRLLADWGEGLSDAGLGAGLGAPSATGDATWVHTFFPSSTWSSPGGDFRPTPSASATVTGLGPHTWASAQMAVDVQGWLDNPLTNFGWLLKGNEAEPRTARRFDSRETLNPGGVPALTLQFTLCGDLNNDGVLDAADVDTFRDFLADPDGFPLSLEGQSKCTVIGEEGGCDILDLTIIRRTVEGPNLSPGISQVCPAAVGPPG